MALQNPANLPRIIPSPPDFHLCDRFYGEVRAPDCIAAARRMPTGAGPVLWTANPRDRYHLDWRTTSGTCTIKIQLGNPNPDHWSFSATPDTFRGMAWWLIEQCAANMHMGGVTTLNMRNMLNWVTDPRTVDVRALIPPQGMFFTVSITNPKDPVKFPGATEPAIGQLVAGSLNLAGRTTSPAPGNLLQQRYWQAAARVRAQSLQMSRGGDVAWYDFALTPKEDMMTYACDASLGAPSEVDCSQLEYAQLGVSGDTLQVGPGVVKFLFSNTCNVAITATVALTLTWAQIKTAISSLANVCVANPLLPAQGGRAYYGAQNSHTLSGRSIRKRDELTGLNALPPHANVTIFQQIEPIPPNAATEIHSCTWNQIVNGGKVASCVGVPQQRTHPRDSKLFR